MRGDAPPGGAAHGARFCNSGWAIVSRARVVTAATVAEWTGRSEAAPQRFVLGMQTETGVSMMQPLHFLKVGAAAIGANALGAVAIGAFALGALATGRLAIREARLTSLKIGNLAVARLTVGELIVTDAAKIPNNAPHKSIETEEIQRSTV